MCKKVIIQVTGTGTHLDHHGKWFQFNNGKYCREYADSYCVLQEKLLSMKRNLGFMCSITMDELGVNQQDNTGAVIEAITAKEKEYEITVRNRDKSVQPIE